MDFRDAMMQLKTAVGSVALGLDESISKSLTELVRMSDLQPATASILVWADGTFQVELFHVDHSDGVRWEKVGNGPSLMTASAMCIGQEWTAEDDDAVEQIDD